MTYYFPTIYDKMYFESDLVWLRNLIQNKVTNSCGAWENLKPEF